MQIDKKDVLYLAAIAVFTFLILSQVKDIPLDSYSSLADAKAKGIAPVIDIIYLPVIIGVIISFVLYLILRTRFQGLPVFIAILLMVTSGAFITNFVLGSFSLPVSMLFGEIKFAPSVSLQRMSETILLLPFALFSFVYLVYKKKYDSKMSIAILASSILGIMAAISFPLLALPFLAFCAANAVQSFKESKEEDIMLGMFMIMGMAAFLMSRITATSMALALFSGTIVALLLYLTDMRHKLNVLLLLCIISLSFIGGTTNIFFVQRLDAETSAALSQLSQVQGNVAVVSVYSEIAPATYYLSGKEIDPNAGLQYAFSEGGEPGFNYLLVDTLVLDDPKNYSARVNQTAKFETFMFGRLALMTSDTSNYTAAIFYSKNSMMIMPVDDKSKPLGDKVQVAGEWVSIYTLLELNATGQYYRYINPKADSNRNILKVLFPDQLLFNESELVWQSNTSRMRLYRFG